MSETGSSTSITTRLRWRVSQYSPGLTPAVLVALAASFLAEHYGASAMLFALLLGMAINYLSEDARTTPGIKFASSTVLRVGVALLGARITFSQVSTDIGWGVAAIIIGAVIASILFGFLCARLFGFHRQFGLLSGGAVGICGASAALAIASALPFHEKKERALIFTVIVVSILSTVAMVLYPMLAKAIGLDARETGIFLGATIHDVAQVVGAGYGHSQAAGDTATVVKLIRVAMLLPVILSIAVVLRLRSGAARSTGPVLPGFVLAFALFVAANSFGLIPAAVRGFLWEASRWLLTIAIASIGMKTNLRELVKVGVKPALMIVVETVFLMCLVAAALILMRP